MNFSSFDLNLLRVFDAMAIERNTRRAGERIGLSQPAVSSALNRLRKVLDDPLFIREGNVMVPTSRATELRRPVHDYLEGLEQLLVTGQTFHPDQSEQTFRIFGADFFVELLLPELMTRLAKSAPGIQVILNDGDYQQIAKGISEGSFDIAFNPELDLPEWISRTPGFTTSFVIVAARNNPEILTSGLQEGEAMPFELLTSLPHVLFSPNAELVGMLDEILKPLNKKRHVAVATPQFYGTAGVVSRTNFIGMLPTAFASVLAERFNLAIYSLPVPTPQGEIFMYWHRRHDADPAHKWFRSEVLDVLSAIDEQRTELQAVGR